MKRYIITAFSGMLLFSSCFEDKGNYDYREVNKVTISGVENSYTIPANVGILNIDPDIDMTLCDPDDARFQYYWIAKYSQYNVIDITDTIGRERVLNWQANLPIYTYDLYLRVEDRETGVVTQKKSTLNLSMYHGRGIMLIGENANGYVQAQMLVMMQGEETVFYDDILEYSDIPPLTGAVDFFHTGNYTTLIYRDIWLCTETRSYNLDRLSLEIKGTFNDKFYFPPETPINIVDIAPKVMANNGSPGNTGQRFHLTSDGEVYPAYFAIYGDVYDAPINRDANALYHTAKGPLLYALNSMSGVIWFDQEGRRFMRAANGIATFGATMTDLETDPFKWTDPEREYVYGENTFNANLGSTNGNSYAIMRHIGGNDADNYDYCIYQLYATTPAKRAFFTVDRTAAPLFGQATSYAFSSNRTVVFYIANGKLYAYDYDPSVKRNYEITLADNNEVTMAKFDVQREPKSDFIYISTYSASDGGTLYKYAIDADLNLVKLKSEPEEKWTGLVKIKNMSWRGCE